MNYTRGIFFLSFSPFLSFFRVYLQNNLIIRKTIYQTEERLPEEESYLRFSCGRYIENPFCTEGKERESFRKTQIESIGTKGGGVVGRGVGWQTLPFYRKSIYFYLFIFSFFLLLRAYMR